MPQNVHVSNGIFYKIIPLSGKKMCVDVFPIIVGHTQERGKLAIALTDSTYHSDCGNDQITSNVH